MSQNFMLAGSLILLAFVSFALQSAFFTTEFRPDEWRNLDQLLDIFAGSVGPVEQVWTRALLTLFNLAVVAALWSVRLIDRDTLLLALVWPLTLFLFSKIYWEFFVFPLCLVRFDLRKRDELLFIAALVALLITTSEANLFIIMLWRLVLLAQKLGAIWAAPVALAALGFALDLAVEANLARAIPVIGEHFARFQWTRDIVNPEYSVFETAQVFAASFHFFSLHDGNFWVDAAFSLLVIAVLMNSRVFWGKLRTYLPVVVALIAVVFFFTAITHAFQNARYYFFFLPVLARLTPRAALLPLACIGLLHVLVRALTL